MTATPYQRAADLWRAGRVDDALSELDGQTSRGGGPASEALSLRADILADAGRLEAAAEALRRLIEHDPDDLVALDRLSRLLPQAGRRAEALDVYDQALERRPDQGMLWVAAMKAAVEFRDYPRLLDVARRAEQRFGRDILTATSLALALSGLGDHARARDLLVPAIAADQTSSSAYAVAAQLFVNLGDLRSAEGALGRAIRLDPVEQGNWAMLGTIWRLRSDPREHWLIDYDNHLHEIALPLDGLSDVATALDALHGNREAPAHQSLRGGTQTHGDLFDRSEPALNRLAVTIRAEVEAWLRSLPVDRSHPFFSRNTGTIDWSGSWSVRLARADVHASHIHRAGWLSSACYVALPSEVGAGEGGALVFGVPDVALGLDLPPQRIVRPAVGTLIVFPSYFWHGTTAFESAQERLTVAFDAVPGRSLGERG